MTPHVLGHPATAEWCKAVDEHHATTERELAETKENHAEAERCLDSCERIAESWQSSAATYVKQLTIARAQLTAAEKRVAELEAALKESVQRDGSWIDKWGSCRVCGGEIPHGHMPKCDVYRYERVERAADAMVTALDMAHDFIQSLEVTNHHVMDTINKSSAAYRAEKDRETT